MAAIKLLPSTNEALNADCLHQGSKTAYIGDPSYSSAAATYIALTNAYRDPTDINGPNESVIDLRNFDTVIALIDYAKGAGTGLRLKAQFGEDDDRVKLNNQETRGDNANFENEVRYELLEHVFEASYRGYIEIPRQSRFMKILVKSDGTPDANDKVAVALFGVILRK